MAIRGNSATVREIKNDIARTIADLTDMSAGIRQGVRSASGWDDQKAAEFGDAMGRVADMIESPVDSLREALPKLERLAQLMDEYTSKRF
ncbi:MAG: hypothetical protein IKG08_09420 [Eubacterium sp.]|nr:hypothetical protein [Eubacterium sp.]MBR3276802.1 hypothetical protein [Eubacterium sp.]